MFSQEEPSTIIEYFENYSCPYFGSAGTIPLQTIILKRGGDDLRIFPSSMENQFRQLGATVKVDNSKLVLLNDYTLCESGVGLTANQSMMAKHLGVNLDEFRIDILGFLIIKTQEYKDLSSNYDDYVFTKKEKDAGVELDNDNDEEGIDADEEEA